MLADVDPPALRTCAALRAIAETLGALLKRLPRRREEKERPAAAAALPGPARPEAELALEARRRSLGRLAAGVAHEINNPLSCVSGNLGVIRDALAEVEKTLRAEGARAVPRALEELADVSEAVADAREGADRVGRIVWGLRALSAEDSEASRDAVCVEDVLLAAVETAAAGIGDRARVVRDVVPVPRVEGSAVRLAQVFLNLIENAAQAIPPGSAGRHTIRVATRAVDGWVEVEVSDTGVGIPPEHRDRVFDPFFTTRPVGAGTGLGLAVCYGIVTGLGGRIDLESGEGAGTTVRVRLPAARLAPSR